MACGGRVLPGHPAEQGALDPGRVLGHARERHRVLKHVLVRRSPALGLHELEERLADRHGLVDRLADDQVAHHRRAGLADRAAERVVGQVLHHGLAVDVLEGDPQRHLVAADRVDVVHLGVKRLPQPLVVGVAVVVQDDLLVQRLGCITSPPTEEALGVADSFRQDVHLFAGVVQVERGPGARGHASARCSGQAQWWPVRTAMPNSSRTWPTSCGCTPVDVEGHRAAPVLLVSGPRMRTPPISPSVSSACAVSASSCAATFCMPSAVR